MGKMKQMLEGSFSQHGHINNLSDEVLELEEENKKLKKKVAQLEDILETEGYYDDNQYTDRDNNIDRDIQDMQSEQYKLDDDKN